MKALSIIANWLFVLCLPCLLLSGSIAWAVNSLWLYERGFVKYDIVRVTDIPQPELNKAAQGLIAYFNSSGNAPIDIVVIKGGQPFTLFNQREVAHLKDVKGLFQLDYKILAVTLVYVLAYAGVCVFRRRWRRLATSVAFGSGLTLAIMLALWIVSLVDFEGFFIQFHLIAFSNNLWELNPYTDYLLMMFPEGFWNDAVIFIAAGAAGVAVALGGVAGWYFLAKRKAHGA